MGDLILMDGIKDPNVPTRSFSDEDLRLAYEQSPGPFLQEMINFVRSNEGQYASSLTEANKTYVFSLLLDKFRDSTDGQERVLILEFFLRFGRLIPVGFTDVILDLSADDQLGHNIAFLIKEGLLISDSAFIIARIQMVDLPALTRCFWIEALGSVANENKTEALFFLRALRNQYKKDGLENEAVRTAIDLTIPLLT
jgi:hypothetical protein